MKDIPQYQFYKTKYGDELLIDMVDLKDIKHYLAKKPLHKLTYYDITLITEGEGLFQVEDKCYTTKQKDLIFTLPNQLRQWDTVNITNGYALIFEGEFLLSFFNDRNFLNEISYFNHSSLRPSKLTLNEEEFKQICQLFEEVKGEIKNYEKKDRHILRAVLYKILKYLDRIFIQENNTLNKAQAKSRYTQRFITLIEKDHGRHHTVQHYADKLCITANYLNELVKEDTGVSAKKLILNSLLAEAKKRLLYTPQSISEISEELFFEDVSYFIRFFRKQTKSTPNRYRNQQKP